MGDISVLAVGHSPVNEGIQVGVISAGSTANTKGSYTELIASTARAYHTLYITITTQIGAARANFLVDIAIGAGGSEQVIVSNIFVREATDAVRHGYGPIVIPISIPAGSRLSTRAQVDQTGSYSYDVTIWGITSSLIGSSGLGLATTYGATTGSSRGTSITSGSANNKGSWTQITASCEKTSVLNLFVNYSDAFGKEYSLVDIAIGAGGSEQYITFNARCTGGGTAKLSDPGVHWYLCHIPAGTRISIRHQHAASSVIDSMSLIGVG